MKKQLIIKISAALIASAFLLLNVGTSRCEPPSDHFREAQSQLSKVMPNQLKTYDQNLEKENHERFQLVEWLIKQSLMKQYQKLEIDLDLEDNLN
jgi:hypothetical protein